MKGVSLIYHVHDFDRLELSTLKVSLAWVWRIPIVFSIEYLTILSIWLFLKDFKVASPLSSFRGSSFSKELLEDINYLK